MWPSRGFSVVELVIVVVLVGVIGITVIARFLSPVSFNEIATRDGLIATIRAAQQASIGRNSTTPGLSAITSAITNTGDDWTFAAMQGGNPIRIFQVPTRNIILETGSSSPSANTCANSFDDALSNFTLEFDNQGNLHRFVNGSTNEQVGIDNINGVRICVNDTVEFSVCVSPSGYAYAGNCEP